MSEAEWLACTEPRDLLRTGRRSDRKLRLFACACCRRIWPQLDRKGRHAVTESERFADGLIDRQALEAARRAVAAEYYVTKTSAKMYARDAASYAVFPAAGAAAFAAAEATFLLDEPAGRVWQCDLLRDVFPFRPIKPKAAWLTSTVVGLARSIYDARAFDRLPILGDALEDAGCANAVILKHCRSGGEHVRGCWVLDTILGLS
jgi:hypothetical protein